MPRPKKITVEALRSLIAEAMNEDDEMWSFEELEVIMRKEHRETLKGVKIDFEMGLSNRGFTYQNPNASTTCGCGTSFS